MLRNEPLSEERRKELEALLAEMQEASGAFYGAAVRLQNHAFIEMTGFMNEYVKICEDALRNGIDFTQVSIHAGGSLPIKSHQAAYLGEKFGCIFGSTLVRDERLLTAFLEAAELPRERKAAR